MSGSLTLFRVRGVPVRAHWTLLLVIPYIALVLSMQFSSVASLAGVEGQELGIPPILWGAILATGLFASVTVHELAHSFVAMRYGGSVKSITLMILGGVSQIVRMPRGAHSEAIMAVAGPVTSLVLGGLFYVGFVIAGAAPVDLRMALFYLGAMNLALGVFNLIPAFPMDGGRVLRAMLAAWLGRERATGIAANVGKAFAIVFGIIGLWSFNFLLMLIAVFIYTGAQAETVVERTRASLEGLRVIDLLPARRSPIPTIGVDDSVEAALAEMRRLDRLELLVIDLHGAPVNVLEAGDLTPLAHGYMPGTVGDVIRRRPPRFTIVDAHAAASEAFEHAAETGASCLLVAEGGEIIAMVALDDLGKSVTLRAIASRMTEAHA